MADDCLLVADDLEVHYPITEGILRREVGRVRAVDGVSFELRSGEALGLVGESGSGKTTTALSTLGLEEPTGGEIRFDGEAIGDLSGDDLRTFRRRAQLIVQDPNEAFSPRMRVGQAVAEPLILHGMDDADRRRAIVEDTLERVGLAASDADRYPHEFSGGEKQRIALARALVPNPDLIVADEPTSALDGRVQSDVLSLLSDVQREFDVAILFISHDIDVVRRFCDRIAVMYLGEIVERGPIDAILSEPAHPYSRVLMGSVPSLDPADRELARPLTDTVPDPSDPPSGCRFHTRCPEYIPPEGVNLSRETWQAVVAFRFTLQTGELPARIEGVTIREQFGLPENIPNSDVDRAVSEAIDRLKHGNEKAAADPLTETTASVCERELPETDTDGRPIACHRYDPAVEADPNEWS
ncbi:ABC transporter ATP-binding protein [Saliphagus sp. LR7]|uniref:ABC transporter ATP-binding protein n=1 Tax=Saliphagus sp. LR7 TaxID=2282654 RepID=UPI000DF73746|nr:oligopeptide/dipeptide ABC transporter ATP-binding protein [Saliphagus sp. LR7]